MGEAAPSCSANQETSARECLQRALPSEAAVLRFCLSPCRCEPGLSTLTLMVLAPRSLILRVFAVASRCDGFRDIWMVCSLILLQSCLTDLS